MDNTNDTPARSGRRFGRRLGRVRLLIGAAGAAALALGAMVLPGTASAATTICNSQTGNSNGYYYSFWTAGGGSACMTLGSGRQLQHLLEQRQQLRRRHRAGAPADG